MEQGFLAPRRASPATLGIVILAHAAVLTAVILAKGPEFLRRPEITKLISISPPETPPPLPPEPQPKAAEPQAPSRIDLPKREIMVPQPDPIEIALRPTPPLPPLPEGPVIVPPPPLPPAHVPVMVDPVVDPRFARAFQPAYPPALMRAEVEGKAIVRVLIGTDGRVKSVEIVSADDPAFAEATRRQALAAWRFRPATRDGTPVEMWRTMTVHFRMEA